MRLTNENRNYIIDRCVTARFAEAKERYEAARTALADALYEHAFGAAEPLAKKLPPGWLSTMQTVYITCDGFRPRYYGPSENEPSCDLKMSRVRLQPSVITDQFKIDQNHPLFSQADALLKLFHSIREGREQLTDQLRTLLYSVHTREKLMEVWPEGEPFFPPIVERKPLPVPYDLALNINKMMGLDKVAKETTV